MIPRIESYGEYSEHYTGTTIKLVFDRIVLFYSYENIVAFRDHDAHAGNLIVCENQWGKITAKHINWLDGGDKKGRLPREQFLTLLQEACERHFV